MDLKSLALILNTVRKFINESNLSYKEELVTIVDGLAWAIDFLHQLGIAEALLNIFNSNEKKELKESRDRLGTIENTEENESINNEKDTLKNKVIKYILPHLSKLMRMAHAIYCDCVVNNEKSLEEVTKYESRKKWMIGLECVAYSLNFAILAWGFYVVRNAKKSNLSSKKINELEGAIQKIEELIEKSNSAFVKQDWATFESLHLDLIYEIDDLNEEIKKIEFEIDNGQICTLRIVETAGYNLAINSVIGAAMNIYEIAQNPSAVLPKIFLALDIVLVGSSSGLIYLSIDTINDLKKSLTRLNEFKEIIRTLRDKHKIKYQEYLKT